MVGRIMLDAGEAPACFFCYGQSKRDLAEWSVQKATQIFNDTTSLLKANPAATKEELGNIFGTWTAIDKNGSPSTLLQLAQKYVGSEIAGKAMANPVRMRDLMFTGAQPANEVEADLANTIKASIQGGIKPNLPKEFAAYSDQLLAMSPAKIAKRNASAGLRINSQTDFRIWHILELEKFLTHAKMKGAMAHVYTREPAFIDIFGDTGIKFNISMEYAHNRKTGAILRDAKGTSIIDSMNTMPWEKILEYRKKYPNDVGSMLVAFTDEDVIAGMRNPNVDMIIPYHSGSVPKAVNEFMGAKDYSAFQHEVWPEQYKPGQQVSVDLSNGKRVNLTVGDPITREHHFNNKKLYLELCDKLGITPRFPQFRNEPGYMKSIIDVARKPSQQKVVDPTKIHWATAEGYLLDYMRKGGNQPDVKVNPSLFKYVMRKLQSAEELKP
jgi:hypothetical protein